MSKKPRPDEEKEEEENEEECEEEEEIEEEPFICRVCKKETLLGDGDDIICVCDNCLQWYDEDRIWDDYDSGVLSDEELKTFDLMQYLSKLGKKHFAKK